MIAIQHVPNPPIFVVKASSNLPKFPVFSTFKIRFNHSKTVIVKKAPFHEDFQNDSIALNHLFALIFYCILQLYD